MRLASRLMSRLLVSASLASLTACASMVERVAATQDTRLLNPDSVQGERKPASLTNPHPGNGAEAANRLRGDDPDCKVSQGIEYKFYCTQAKSERNWKSSEDAERYLAAGLTLSNETCDAWFTRVQITQVTFRQSSDVISTMGSVTAAILGFTKTPPETIGLTASLFGSVKQANDNLTANYVVSADLTSVASAVREYRALYASEIEQAPASRWNYYTARRVIMAYDNTCSALFIRRFVNTRVEGRTSPEREPLVDAAINAFAGESTRYFTKAVSTNQLVDIYAYLYLSKIAPETRKRLAAQLTADGLLTGDAIAFKSGVTSQALTNALIFANIDSALRERATQRAAELTALVAREAAEAKKNADDAKVKAQDAERKAGEAEVRAFTAEGFAQQAIDKANAAEAKAQSATAGAEAEKAGKEAVRARAEADRLLAEVPALRATAAVARAEAQALATKAQTAAQAAAILEAGAVGGGVEADAVPRAPSGRPLDTPPRL